MQERCVCVQQMQERCGVCMQPSRASGGDLRGEMDGDSEGGNFRMLKQVLHVSEPVMAVVGWLRYTWADRLCGSGLC